MSDSESLVRSHMKRLEARDVDGLVSEYADDAVLSAFGKDRSGKEAIRDFFQKTVDRTAPGATYELASLAVDGDEVEVTWNLVVPDGEAPLATGGDRFQYENGAIVRQSVWVGPKPD